MKEILVNGEHRFRTDTFLSLIRFLKKIRGKFILIKSDKEL